MKSKSLPWKNVKGDNLIHDDEGGWLAEFAIIEDAEYATHAGNAYPRLVENLKNTADGCGDEGCALLALELLRELGEL